MRAAVPLALGLFALPAGGQTNWVQPPCVVFDCRPAVEASEALRQDRSALAEGLRLARVQQAGPGIVVTLAQELGGAEPTPQMVTAHACGTPELRKVIDAGFPVSYKLTSDREGLAPRFAVSRCEGN